MGSYYYLTTSEGTEYKINLDAIDFGLLPIEKLLNNYQYKESCIKLRIFDAKQNISTPYVECTDKIKGNHLEFQVEECLKSSENSKSENIKMIKNENIEIGKNESLKMTKKEMKKYVNLKTDCRKLKIMDDEIEDFINKTSKLSIVFCSLCKIYLRNNQHNIAGHNAETIHSHLKSEDNIKNNAIFHVKIDDKALWCKICKTDIKNTQRNLFHHIYANIQHISWFEKIDRFIEVEDVNIVEFCEIIAQNKAFCERCNVWVPCCDKSLTIHIKGSRHKRLGKISYSRCAICTSGPSFTKVQLQV